MLQLFIPLTIGLIILFLLLGNIKKRDKSLKINRVIIIDEESYVIPGNFPKLSIGDIVGIEGIIGTIYKIEIINKTKFYYSYKNYE